MSSDLDTAKLALQAGAAGIIVSNHGARQLDHVSATISALEEVSDTFISLYVLDVINHFQGRTAVAEQMYVSQSGRL